MKPTRGQSGSPARPLTILLVEDEGYLRAAVKGLLERRGFQVLAASCASEALEFWSKHCQKIDLLLTDMVLPGRLSGWELAARFRQEKPVLQVILATGGMETVGPKRSGLTGFILLEKPFEPPDLFGAVEQALDGRGRSGLKLGEALADKMACGAIDKSS